MNKLEKKKVSYAIKLRKQIDSVEDQINALQEEKRELKRRWNVQGWQGFWIWLSKEERASEYAIILMTIDDIATDITTKEDALAKKQELYNEFKNSK